MRANGINDAYEQVKALTRGQAISREALQEFIASLDIPAEQRDALMSLSPAEYTGMAAELAENLEATVPVPSK